MYVHMCMHAHTHMHTHSTDKTRWMESMERQDVQKDEEKIYQMWGKWEYLRLGYSWYVTHWQSPLLTLVLLFVVI